MQYHPLCECAYFGNHTEKNKVYSNNSIVYGLNQSLFFRLASCPFFLTNMIYTKAILNVITSYLFTICAEVGVAHIKAANKLSNTQVWNSFPIECTHEYHC